MEKPRGIKLGNPGIQMGKPEKRKIKLGTPEQPFSESVNRLTPDQKAEAIRRIDELTKAEGFAAASDQDRIADEVATEFARKKS